MELLKQTSFDLDKGNINVTIRFYIDRVIGKINIFNNNNNNNDYNIPEVKILEWIKEPSNWVSFTYKNNRWNRLNILNKNEESCENENEKSTPQLPIKDIEKTIDFFTILKNGGTL